MEASMAGLLRGCLLFLIALVVLGVLAYHFFGIWGFLAFAALLMVAVGSIKSILGFGLKKAFMVPFKAKGAVLKDARVTVNSIEPTTAVELVRGESENDDEDEDETRCAVEVQYDWYLLDVTISPKPPTGG